MSEMHQEKLHERTIAERVPSDNTALGYASHRETVASSAFLGSLVNNMWSGEQ